MRRRRAVAAALLLPILVGCGAAAAEIDPAGAPASTTVAVAPTTTATTWPLSQPVTPPDDDYFDEAVVEVGRIAVPALGIDDVLHQGLSLHNIDLGPSHWPGTALPGHVGDVVVAGHRVTHSHPFRDLDALGAGDTVTFTTADGTFTYEWTSTEVVTPDRVDIADQLPEYEATLYACHPPGSARERIVAHFRLVGAPAPGQPDPSALPVALPVG
jgi:sortase A